MANELSIIELLGKVPGCPVRYTIGAATAVPKGSLCVVTDPRTIAIHSGIDQPVVGVAAMEHDTTSGLTSMTVYTNGIFDITAAAAGAQNVGKAVATSATVNMSTAADANDLIQGSLIGFVLEEQANDERCAVRILK